MQKPSGCEFGCGPDDEFCCGPGGGGIGVIPACPVHGWICESLDARDEQIALLEERCEALRSELEEQEAENLLVEDLLADIRKDRDGWIGRADELRAENERLREALTALALLIRPGIVLDDPACAQWHSIIDSALREEER